MNGSEVATWIQAIGSAGSLLAFATWVGIAVINRRDEFEARFAQQAQTVAAWLDKGANHDSDDEFVICALNAGSSPVYRCHVRFPGLAERDEPSGLSIDLLPPHTTLVRPFPAPSDGSTPTRLAELTYEDIYSTGVAPELQFVDTSGRRWHRDSDGQLANITERSRLRPNQQTARQSRANVD